MLVWILLIMVWLIVLMTIGTHLDLEKVVLFLAILFILDTLALAIWASDWLLRYHQVWPYIPQ